jgi:hypothetical protein
MYETGVDYFLGLAFGAGFAAGFLAAGFLAIFIAAGDFLAAGLSAVFLTVFVDFVDFMAVFAVDFLDAGFAGFLAVAAGFFAAALSAAIAVPVRRNAEAISALRSFFMQIHPLSEEISTVRRRLDKNAGGQPFKRRADERGFPAPGVVPLTGL